MPKCIECGSYTKFEKGLCYDCYKEKNPKEELITGMNDRESNYRFNMIKGKIAETLIQELFLQMKYSVFRYGMENTVPGVMDLLKGVKSEVAEEIKRMPDFVIQDPKNGEVYFIEVKFRASGKFSFKDLPKGYAWENVFFVIVSRKHIKCITYQELKEGKDITPESRNYLGNRKEFETDKDTIKEFCDFALTFFEGV
jgi:hypothetical protein